MLEEYLKLLESFKQNQISALIKGMNAKIFEILTSPKASLRIVPYFKELIELHQDGLPFEEIYKKVLPFTDYERDPDNISQIKKLINALYHAQLTFVDLETVDVRRNLGDLKKLYDETINKAYEASYLATHLDVDLKTMFHEELAFILPLLNQIPDFVKSPTELAKIIPDQNNEQKEASVNKLQKIAALIDPSAPLSYKVGEIVGIAADQMRPIGGDVDYNFLTQFSAVLPGYLDQLTQYIQQYSSQIEETEPGLNQEALDELKNAALYLLNDIETLKGNSLFVSLKFLNYIHIIRHIITLSMSTLDQIGELSEASQNLIRDRLAQLKYGVFPKLLSLVDKIEEHALLKPGTLSIPLMRKIEVLYDAILYLPKKAIDFKAKGSELLHIEDSRFMELRLERTYQRIDQAEIALYKNQRAEKACNSFFSILNKPQYQNLCLHQLPLKTKQILTLHYKLLKPYMTQVDIDLNDLLIEKLQDSSVENWQDHAVKPWYLLTKQRPASHISFVLAKQKALEDLISKHEKSQLFHITLNKDLISSVQTDLALFPYSETSNVFCLDESIALQIKQDKETELRFKKVLGDTLIDNPEQLTGEQALKLFQWYHNKRKKFIESRKTYVEFIELFKTPQTPRAIRLPNTLDEEIKNKYRKLYHRFQTYFIDAVPHNKKEMALKLDKYFIDLLSNEAISDTNIPPINMLLDLDKQVQNYFDGINTNWRVKTEKYACLSQEKIILEQNTSKLEHDPNISTRAHYIIQHTNYSQAIHQFRIALFEATKQFNQSMQAELVPKSLGGDNKKLAPNRFMRPIKNMASKLFSVKELEIPFPEMKDNHKRLAQSRQVCALKDLFNSLAYLEGIVLELEELNNKSAKSLYVNHLLQAYGHINEIIKLSKRLAADPHTGFIARELMDKAQTLYATFQEHSDAYKVGADEVPYGGNTVVRYNPLWHTVNTAIIIPQHIRALKNTSYLTTEKLNHLHTDAKKATLIIEELIESSDSHIKLFMKTPKMLSLYRTLKKKLNEFATTTHDAVLNNLHQIRAKALTPMLLQADRYEDKLGLKPGALSDPLKKITDDFYKGLLHPLDLDSSTHIALICDKVPLATRTTLIQKQIKNVKRCLKKIDKEYQNTEHLYDLIQRYKRLSAQSELFACSNEIRACYKKVLPQLTRLKLKKCIDITPSSYEEDHQLDALCNQELKHYEPHHTEIEELITSTHYYYLGLKATHQMRLHTAEEKLTYLAALHITQKQERLDFIEEYTTEAFKKHLEISCNHHVGLVYTGKEYRAKLEEHLLTFKNEIIDQSKTAQDINLEINRLLQKKICVFEKKHYKEYYHLDTVRAALAQFKNYLSLSTAAIQNKNSLFESEKTLDEKTLRINKLDDIAEKSDLSIQERLSQIKERVKDPNFSRIILAHKQTNVFSITYLKLCFLSLLEALKLYMPERKELLNRINDAVTNQPPIDELAKRFRLFAATTKGTEKQGKRYEVPSLRIESGITSRFDASSTTP